MEKEDVQTNAFNKETFQESTKGPETIVREEPKLGRNELCWCDSGKKYKHCHGI